MATVHPLLNKATSVSPSPVPPVPKPTRSRSSRTLGCLWIYIIRSLELLLMLVQIIALAFDWPASCRRGLHLWMLLALLYRLISIAFQWIFLEPCLRHLRKNRTAKLSKQDIDMDSSCGSNLLFGWVFVWLWVIDNDICLLLWTIIGSLMLVYNTHASVFSCIMVTVLLISYLYWSTALLLAVCARCCPMRMHTQCLRLGCQLSTPDQDAYGVAVPPITDHDHNHHHHTINQDKRASYTPPQSLHHHQETQSDALPLPHHILKTFARKIYTKRSSGGHTDSSASSHSHPAMITITTVHVADDEDETPTSTQDTDDDEPSFLKQCTNGSLLTAESTSEEPPLPQELNMANSFSSMRYWLHAKRDTLSHIQSQADGDGDLDGDGDGFAVVDGNEPRHTESVSMPVCLSCTRTVWQCLLALSSMPAPVCLRRAMVTQHDYNAPPGIAIATRHSRAQSVFAPPLTQQILQMRMVSSSAFGPRLQDRKSIVSDSDLITDVGEDFCALCHELYAENEKLIVLSCAHQFHEQCVKQWFERKSRCPVCKRSYV